MTIWLLFHETNSGHFDESDGYVQAVFATEELANAARLAALRQARDEGLDIWQDPDDEDDEGDPMWDHDWRVEQHDVLTVVPDPIGVL